MKTKIFFYFGILLLFSNTLFCQVRIYFDDVKVYNNGDIKVSVTAQNVGRRTEYWVSYGTKYCGDNVKRSQYPITAYNSRIFNFHIYYKDISSGQYVIETPSSITIKTIFGTYIEMDQPSYEMPSTGSGGQQWQILFTNIPLKSEIVEVVILGNDYLIGDMPLAVIGREERDIKVQNLISEGNQYEKQNDFKNAIISYTKAIKLDDSKYKSLSHKVGLGFFNLAEKDFDNKDYESAIENYELCMNADGTYQEKISKYYAESLFQVANNYYKKSEYDLASDMFKKSIEIDNSIKEKVISRFKSICINQFSNVVISSFPGVLQLYRGNMTTSKVFQIFNGKITEDNMQVTKGLLMLGSFSVFSFFSYATHNIADDYYQQYQEAMTEIDAADYYDKTISSQKTSQTFMVLSIASALWNIYDSYEWVKWHNEKFTLNSKKLSTLIVPRINGDQFTLSLVFEF